MYESKIHFTDRSRIGFLYNLNSLKNSYIVEKDLLVLYKNIVKITNDIVTYLLENYFEVVRNKYMYPHQFFI